MATLRGLLFAVVLATVLIAPCALDAATSTHSFTNTSKGAHPSTLTFVGGVISVNMSALPDGVQVYRAMLVHDRGGNGGAYPRADNSYQPLQVEAVDAPGVWLSTVAPRHYHLDCTAAVQRAVSSNPKTLTLNVVSFPELSWSPYIRIDVWCDELSFHTIDTVTGFDVRHETGDTMIRFREPLPLLIDPNTTCDQFETVYDSIDDIDRVRYRIYRHTVAIDDATIRDAELVDEIKPLSGWDPYYYGRDWRDAVFGFSIVPRLPVDDLVIAATDEGIYVRRAASTASVFYAVSRVVNGEEDLSNWTAGQNCSASAVAEASGTGLVLLREEVVNTTFQYVNNANLHYYVRWDCAPDFNRPSDANHYLVAEPPIQVDAPPLDVALHCWGGTLNGGYGWWYEAENGALMLATNQKPYDWWIGSHDNYDTIRPLPDDVQGNGGGRGRNFSSKRLLSFIDGFMKPTWNIDDDRILVTGSSMGGSGAIMWGARAADRFAYANGWVGIYVPRGSSHFFSSFESVYGVDSWNCTYESTGEQIFDYWDTEHFILADPAQDIPYLCCANGKNDSAIGWDQARRTVLALQQTRQPHKFVWGQSGHGQRSILPGESPSDHYIGVTISRGKTLPAFTNCSQDGDMGNGDPLNGDDTGHINQYLLWEPDSSREQVGRWEMTVYLIPGSPDTLATVDITPRRCRLFRPIPGMVCDWENRNAETSALIAAGTAPVDVYSLVTLPGITVNRKDINRNRIVITHAAVAPGVVKMRRP